MLNSHLWLYIHQLKLGYESEVGRGTNLQRLNHTRVSNIYATERMKIG